MMFPNDLFPNYILTFETFVTGHSRTDSSIYKTGHTLIFRTGSLIYKTICWNNNNTVEIHSKTICSKTLILT